VGLGPNPNLTHWATIANFIPPRGNPNTSGLTWRELNINSKPTYLDNLPQFPKMDAI
jgi:hypothetical protein